MGASDTFAPGEVAVLCHGEGGRLFTVERQDGERVFEKPWLRGQPSFDVHRCWLLKCAEAGEAQALVDQLAKAQAQRVAARNAADAIFKAECERIYATVKP